MTPFLATTPLFHSIMKKRLEIQHSNLWEISNQLYIGKLKKSIQTNIKCKNIKFDLLPDEIHIRARSKQAQACKIRNELVINTWWYASSKKFITKKNVLSLQEFGFPHDKQHEWWGWQSRNSECSHATNDWCFRTRCHIIEEYKAYCWTCSVLISLNMEKPEISS